MILSSRLGTVTDLPHSLFSSMRFNNFFTILSVFVPGLENTWYGNTSAISPFHKHNTIHIVVGQLCWLLHYWPLTLTN